MVVVLKLRKQRNKYITVKANEDNNIILDTSNITSTATFVNYDDECIIIQFILVRGTDNKVRIALNTCQVCNPSPKAYFIQEGEYLVCQNCGTKFHINKIGIEKGWWNHLLVTHESSPTGRMLGMSCTEMDCRVVHLRFSNSTATDHSAL